MNVLKAMTIFTVTLLISTFISIYVGGMQVYPQTTAEVSNCLSNFTTQVDSQTATTNSSTSASASYGTVLDVVGLLVDGMISIFNVFVDLANIIRLYIVETFQLIGLSLIDNILFTAFMEVVGLSVQVFIVLSVIEWIRPGFTKT